MTDDSSSESQKTGIIEIRCHRYADPKRFDLLEEVRFSDVAHIFAQAHASVRKGWPVALYDVDAGCELGRYLEKTIERVDVVWEPAEKSATEGD